MNVLLDTNILARSAQPDSPLHAPARAAIAALKHRGDDLCVLPQILYEFWVVCTRPREQYGGFGMSTNRAHAELTEIKALFTFLPDPPNLYDEWEQLVVQHDVKGKTAHDARLVAAMNRHGLTHILTFNATDFARFPGIVVLTSDTLGV